MVRRVRFLVGLLALVFFAAAPLVAQRFEARVLRVKDGDSFLVERIPQKRVSEVRLAGIDAPELGQPWGLSSRSALRRLISGQRVTVDVIDRDRYGRLVSKVFVGQVYVNAAMTRSGNAWAFSRFLPDAAIRAGHHAARKEGKGLWSLPPEQRVPPATWRETNPRQER
ncbi:thermonuclease family protein [Thermaurantiacus sp.]